MNLATSMVLRRMRVPFIILITVYSFSILGMVLIPGVDEHGNTMHMSFFHAFYFVSYTATTIGFGEIPYPLTDAQRLLAVVIIYTTVIAWFYALGKILSLVQDKTFRKVLEQNHIAKEVKSIQTPFFLICGYGETGTTLVKALIDEHFGAVVIEQNSNSLNELALNELNAYVPSINGDATEPKNLELAGIRHDLCKGVIAITASDETNLKIAIISKLLHPGVPVVCRSELKEFEENMLSFGTDYIVNPFDAFADIFAMAIHSPSQHLIYDWLTGPPNTKLTEPIYVQKGHWILCGFGRFGRNIFNNLVENNLSVTVIDPSEEVMDAFRNDPANDNYQFICARGIDSATLIEAGMSHAAGIVAGCDNDSNNLSIIMTAQSIKEDVFIVARQNKLVNYPLYNATNADIIMRHREIVARKIRVIFLAPLLLRFFELAIKKDNEWANITISRISAIVGEYRPNLWSVRIDEESSPAIVRALEYGRTIKLSHIMTHPSASERMLKCVPLLMIGKNGDVLMPEETTELRLGDIILFCGLQDVMNSMRWTQRVMSSLNFVMTMKDEPQSSLWRAIYRHFNHIERRKSPR